jgi:NTP pyrophosphatase (non-canonical NTP hydrolase)
MTPDKRTEAFISGMRTAMSRFERIFPNRDDYARSLDALYSKLEDEIHSLYLRVEHRDYAGMLLEAGDVIAYASMIANLAEERIFLGKKFKTGGKESNTSSSQPTNSASGG